MNKRHSIVLILMVALALGCGKTKKVVEENKGDNNRTTTDDTTKAQVVAPVSIALSDSKLAKFSVGLKQDKDVAYLYVLISGGAEGGAEIKAANFRIFKSSVEGLDADLAKVNTTILDPSTGASKALAELTGNRDAPEVKKAKATVQVRNTGDDQTVLAAEVVMDGEADESANKHYFALIGEKAPKADIDLKGALEISVVGGSDGGISESYQLRDPVQIPHAVPMKGSNENGIESAMVIDVEKPDALSVLVKSTVDSPAEGVFTECELKTTMTPTEPKKFKAFPISITGIQPGALDVAKIAKALADAKTPSAKAAVAGFECTTVAVKEAGIAQLGVEGGERIPLLSIIQVAVPVSLEIKAPAPKKDDKKADDRKKNQS